METSLIGRRLGQYDVLARLGRGQHSVVYKAWQKNLERYVTLKVLYRCDEGTRQKLQEEALLTADLIQRGAPNIRQIYEVGQTDDGYLFVALEYVEGSLHSVMERARQSRRFLDPAAAARLLMPVAQALDAVHSMGWVHLDIKPQNILISSMGRAMLADFGIARRRGTHTHACTPLYASPEQADGGRPVGPWSDVYSLGAVLYEMVTGRPPFQAELDLVILNKHLTEVPTPPRKLNRRVSARQERAILRALSRLPAGRPQAASELLQGLLPAGGLVSGIAGASSGALCRTAGWTQRLPRLVLAGVLMVLLLGVLLLVAWTLWPLLAPGPPAKVSPPAVSEPTRLPAVSEPTRPPTLAATPTATVQPTSTLAPTPTRTPRPRPTATSRPTATATAAVGVSP